MKILLSAICITVLLSKAAIAFEPDIIIDANENSANVELYPTANWINDGTVTQAFRGASKGRSSSLATDFARFHTTLPAEGPWKVYIWHNGGNASNIATTITHALGSTQVAYSQIYYDGGRWMLLGVFWFNDTAEAEVKIAGAASKLSADAVRFSLATPDVILDSSAAGVIASPSGDWATVSTPAGHELSLRRSNTSGATLTFSPTIPTAGEYEISLWLPPASPTWYPPASGNWLPSGGTAATSFTVDVHARNGTVTSHTVNMPASGVNEGRWVQIGTEPYLLDATPPPGQPNPTPTKVVIKTNAGSTHWVPADAVRFTKVGADEIYADNDGSGVAWLPSLWASGAALSARDWGSQQMVPFSTGYRAEYFSGYGYANPKSVTFTPDLQELGLYDVYLWSPKNTSSYYPNLSNTNVTTRTALGDVTRSFDQGANMGMWSHVGRYILYPQNHTVVAQRPWIKLEVPSYNSGGYIVADAALFIRDTEDVDADGDGLPDWHEVLLATSTSTADTNGDGIPDGWDTDGDGMSDGDEYRIGRNPLMTAADGSSLMTLQIHTPTFR